MHAFYLHGFASSSRSQKAAYFGERLKACGIELRCPDFNEPDFSTLTVTRMVEQLSADIAGLSSGPIALIGSSLGGVVAILTAERMPERITRLVLLAPALAFPRDAAKILGDERFARWRTDKAVDIFHFGFGQPRLLNYTFYEDALRYDASAVSLCQPVLIFQGRWDLAVDPRMVEAYAAARPKVTLTLFDDDHQLMASLPAMWTEMSAFLGVSEQ